MRTQSSSFFKFPKKKLESDNFLFTFGSLVNKIKKIWKKAKHENSGFNLKKRESESSKSKIFYLLFYKSRQYYESKVPHEVVYSEIDVLISF